MSRFYRWGIAILLVLSVHVIRVDAAELQVHDLSMSAGTTADLLVSGAIAGESTFGVEVLLEIIPRAGVRGTLSFTPSPPPDIIALEDPWPDEGMFSAFDTDITLSTAWNGCVNTNGSLEAQEVNFAGMLAGFPVVASADASGVWDVVLATSVGNSSWEAVPTTLLSGTITVTSSDDIPTVSEWGLVVTALLLLAGGTIVISRRIADAHIE